MRAMTTAGVLALAAVLAAGCDDRRERVEETAAPGMEADAAAPESGPVDGFEQVERTPAATGDTLVDPTLPPVTPQGGQQQPQQGTPPPGG